MLVGFGQTICRPIGPKCYDCSIKSLCKFNDKTKQPSESKKSKKATDVVLADELMKDALSNLKKK